MKYYIAICALLFLLFQRTSSANITYQEAYDLYCSANVTDPYNLTEDERAALRASQKYLAASAEAIQDAVTNKSVQKIFQQIGAPIILTIILLVFCLISFIIYLCFFCCCKRASSTNPKTAKIIGGVGLLMLLVYVGLFVAGMVYMGKVKDSNNSAYCLIPKVVKDLLDGITEEGFQFVGFNYLASILGKFKDEIDQISGLSADFDAISGKNLPGKTKAALDSLPPFYAKYKDSKTADGAGATSNPLTIQNLGPNINDGIYTEFQTYDQVAKSITDGAKAGKQFVQNNQIASIKNNTAQIISNLQSLQDNLQSVFNDSDSATGYYRSSYGASFGVSLALGILLFLLGIASFVFIGLMLRNGNNKGRVLVKIMLSVAGFLIFVIGIIAVALIILSATIGSFCNVLGGLLSTTTPVAELQKYNISAENLTADVVNSCLPVGASGDLSPLFSDNSTNFNSSQQFIDGLSVYQGLRDNLTAFGSYSPSINYTVDVWKKFQVSVFPDQPNALQSLAQLNNLVNCDGSSFQLNVANCTGSSSACKGVYDTAAFTPPGCSGNAASASSLFTNLKASTSDEDKLLAGMIEDLQGSGAGTPLSLNAQVRDGLKGILASIDNIKAKLTNTFALASKFSNGFGKAVNCTVFRKELSNTEDFICFGLNKNLYVFAVLVVLCVFFLFLFSWALCLTLWLLPKQYQPVYMEAPHSVTDYSVNDGQSPLNKGNYANQEISPMNSSGNNYQGNEYPQISFGNDLNKKAGLYQEK